MHSVLTIAKRHKVTGSRDLLLKIRNIKNESKKKFIQRWSTLSIAGWIRIILNKVFKGFIRLSVRTFTFILSLST